MKVAATIEEVRSEVRQWKKEGLTVGLVPTTGCLHEGQASLIKASVRQCGRTVVFVFEPSARSGADEIQSGSSRDFERDAALCENLGADLLFHPSAEELYAGGRTEAYVELLDELHKQLCGKTHPLHALGVCTVVSKLFNIVQPDKAFFGEKDAQQLAILRRMVQDLSYGVEIIGCPTVREADGLAMSIRNAGLSPEERKAARCLSRAVALGKKMVLEGERDARVVVNAMKNLINHEPLARIDFVQAMDGVTLEPTDTIAPDVLVAMAVYIGKTRLIDNFSVRI